jgi:hypothetical protein
MPACDLDRNVAFCFYNKREKPNTLVSVFSGEVQSKRLEKLEQSMSATRSGSGWDWIKSFLKPASVPKHAC